MSKNTSCIDAVLFDLDGTLADTARDLGWALNTLLAEEGREPLAFEVLRPMASHGARGLIEVGFGISPEAEEFERLRQRFLTLYATHYAVDTVLFPGINAMLEGLAQRSLPWGIVTNKPKRFTEPLVPCLGLSVAPGVVVSGDSVGAAKPDPAPMLYAAHALRVSPERCLYVGDAERDIIAGRVTGMKTVCALYGYLAATDQPETWSADYQITHPNEILGLLA